jgi:formamidopyrimidine-DNA glycosylase
LLNQAFLAGMGNIYVDEALYASRLHPRRRAATLTADEAARLYRAIRAVLRDGIAREGASVNWYRKPDGTKGSAQAALKVYGRAGEPCARCGHLIEKIVVGQRGTHLCPACQTC